MKKNSLTRRRFLIASSSVVGAVGASFVAWPFIDSLNPSERAKGAGAPVSIDFSKITPGRQVTVPWRQKPVWILHRTPEMLQRMQTDEHLQRLRDPDSNIISQQPDYSKNEFRSLHPEHMVVVAICTHLGCIPTFRPELAPEDLGKNWVGGYLCPCHGSRFDFAGRVFKGVPAPTNLVVPPYRYLSESVIEIGVDNEVKT